MTKTCKNCGLTEDKHEGLIWCRLYDEDGEFTGKKFEANHTRQENKLQTEKAEAIAQGKLNVSTAEDD